MPDNVTSRYTVECEASASRSAVLLTKVSDGAFDYEFEARLGVP
jgi:hypothetical protein